MPRLRRRPAGEPDALPAHLHPLLRRVYAARGLRTADELDLSPARLLPPQGLLGVERAAELLEQAIADRRRICIAGDYDADGATATAVAVLGLRALGAATVDYVVPDRFTMGYGLSPALVERARALDAELLVTVDNGIASHAGVAAANDAGLQVIVTDHHLPPAELPAAAAIVNPNQPGCGFASKHLAGVGVMFYLLLALRARLRLQGVFLRRAEPNLAELLDLVALGTVADLVRLDHNNRILVEQGLSRMRDGRLRPGLAALLAAAGRQAQRLTAADLGFALAPRLNAAGRLEDMRIGIQCLLAEDLAGAVPLAQRLDALNRERRELQTQMCESAVERLAPGDSRVGVCVHDAGWHEGVIGLVASRLRERLHRPVIAFAPATQPELLKGSGRSIPGLHLRDVLADIDAGRSGLIERFGGHAMAAGLTLAAAQLPAFADAFDAACRARLNPSTLEAVLDSDGELAGAELSLEAALALEQGGPWGQGFPEPLFDGVFEILDTRPVGGQGQHLRYRLRTGAGQMLTAIHFNGAEQAASSPAAHLAYRLTVNRFQGSEAAELTVVERWPCNRR
ncbi:MAG: single-stranded-DNA-specific exonuclease RecJ [Gammaproteobacteria bacterium]|nr:single-stranded-DNA-specific exonuclease RecJ [Gammaproteobacteria bacterium]